MLIIKKKQLNKNKLKKKNLCILTSKKFNLKNHIIPIYKKNLSLGQTFFFKKTVKNNNIIKFLKYKTQFLQKYNKKKNLNKYNIKINLARRGYLKRKQRRLKNKQ